MLGQVRRRGHSIPVAGHCSRPRLAAAPGISRFTSLASASAEVPRDVELLEFPGEVMVQIPEVRHYRYLVTGNDVIIVDPNDHAVALVINE